MAYKAKNAGSNFFLLQKISRYLLAFRKASFPCRIANIELLSEKLELKR
jgi:hypothetical protein